MGDKNDFQNRQAVALTYEPGTTAPTYVADKIIKTAQENEVPLYEDGELSDTLMRLEIGDTIPPELYKVVADILVFVDNMDKIKGKLNSTKKKQ